MSAIGVETNIETLVLWKGRDFKWNFENINSEGVAEDFPAGDLFFEFVTGGEHNALQSVVISGASDGTYKLGLEGNLTSNIDYYDATSNPYGIDEDITTALEALPNIGAGNVLVHPARLYPVWEIEVTLNGGKNEVQSIKINGKPTGGLFKLAYEWSTTPTIPFGATDVQVKTALEELPGIGSGNTVVTKISNFEYRVEFVGAKAATPMSQIIAYGGGLGFSLTGDFFATMSTQTITNGLAKLTEPLVNVLNTTVNDVFDSFEALLGVDIEFQVNDELNAKMKATSRRAFVESDIITFNTDLTGVMIQNAINNVMQFAGLLETVVVDFYWNHHYEVEFINDLALKPIPKLTADTTNLVGEVGIPKIDIEVLEPGKERLTIWSFDITGPDAVIKIESDKVDEIPYRCDWQLVFLPAGEAAGGDPVTRGRVKRVGS